MPYKSTGPVAPVKGRSFHGKKLVKPKLNTGSDTGPLKKARDAWKRKKKIAGKWKIKY